MEGRESSSGRRKQKEKVNSQNTWDEEYDKINVETMSNGGRTQA